ncbi:hypothetical protein H6P81_012204 [Aristolochia fimbriata]|uniref:J domain-containing protein n=1 Tax=Aristolochia fimbriata TaxID=158543 RepID=A0AAV7ECF6_ARIFI|nr:hypothetical protein H6P81_012204 [Aristolochia fimbriata]
MSCRLVSDGISSTPRSFCCKESAFGTSWRRSVVVSFDTHLQKPSLKASATLILPHTAGAAHAVLLHGWAPLSTLNSVWLDVSQVSALRSAVLGYPLPKSARFRTFSVRGDEFAAIASDATFYELLGISENVGFSEIKQAYKQMALKYHPDVSPPDQTEEYTKRFIRVQQAYETLSDARKREIYDRDLARGLHYAFSARKRFDQELEEKTAWRNRWQDQVAGLKRRSMHRASEGNLSWGARMRRMRRQSSEDNLEAE